MRLIRHVPLGPALLAAGEVMDYTADRDETNYPFSLWYNESGTINQPSLGVEALEALLPEVPDTPAGQAWVAEARACLALTLADQARPYDEAEYDTDAERQAVRDLDDLAEALRALSPLLDPVADAVDRQAPFGRFDLSEVVQARAILTEDGILIGGHVHDGHCDCDPDDYTIPTRGRLAHWDDINHLAPAFRQALTSLLTVVDADLPEVGDSDAGAGRRSR